MALKVSAQVSEADRHLKDVTTLKVAKGKLYSAAEDGIIKVWSLDLKLIREVQAHQSVVYNLAIRGDTIYSCSNDGTIESWDLETGKNKQRILEYDDEVWKMYVTSDGRLFSGDNKGMVTLWENDKQKLIWNLVEEVRDLVVVDNLLYTVRDRDVVITEVKEEGMNRYATRGTLEGSSPMCLVGSHLCFASRSASDIYVHDNSKGAHFKRLGELQPAHSMIINALVGTGENTLYSAGYDKVVKQWDVAALKETGACEVGNVINVLEVGPDGQVYAGGSDGFICRIDTK